MVDKKHEPKLPFPPTPPNPITILKNIAIFIRETSIGISQADRAIKGFDRMFAEVDKVITNPLAESTLIDNFLTGEPEDTHTGYTGETKSYEGQSDASYCAECLVSHWATIYGLLEEADRLSLNEANLNRESINRIKEALKELKASLYDLQAVDRPWVEEFKASVRTFRKRYLVPLLAEPNKEQLHQAVTIAKQIYDKTIELLRMEREMEKSGAIERSTEEVDAELERQLTYFINKKDIKHLEKAYILATKSGCPACVKYVAAALDAAREGRMDEAIEWARGVRRGIRVTLNEVKA